MSDIASLFDNAAARYGLAPEYLRRTAQIESGMNPNARNPNSSAGGLFQFIDGTARQYGLQNKFDPAQATDAAARLAADNARTLRGAIGRDPTPAELYLAHQQGGGGAAKLLSNPDAPAASLVGSRAVSLNGGNPNMTAAQFASLWTNKFNAPSIGGGAMKPGTGLPMMAQAGAPAPVTLPQPQAAPMAQMALAQMFQQNQAQEADAERARADQRQAEVARRRALFG